MGLSILHSFWFSNLIPGKGRNRRSNQGWNHFGFYGFTSDDTAFAVFKLDSIILCGGISDFNAVFILKVGIFTVLTVEK